MRLRRLAAALLAAALGGCDLEPGRVDDIVHADGVEPRRVETAAGPVVGAAAAGGQAFLGIPYAAPPVGPLRWRAPQPPAPWTEPRDATRLGPSCLQNLALSAQLGGAGGGPTLGQEDCLTLNVYAPPGAAPDARKPVMVWIHGGALVLGTSGQYDPSALARREGVVVVTVNYRLGALGFFAHPSLRGEPGEGAFALLDQRAALAWVKRDIAGFGGDPRSVTVFGQSAGAWSACYQMASPGSAGLFQRAILQSGACVTPETSVAPEVAEAGGFRMAGELGCAGPDALACLRALPAADVVEAAPERPGVTGPNSWAPVAGLDVLPLAPRAAFASGRFAPVPVIDGTNRDEGRLFSYLRGLRADLLTEASYGAEIRRLFGARAPAILAAYPASRFDSPRAAYAAVLTDGFFACPALDLDRLVGARAPVYAYEFDDPDPPFALPRLPFSGGAGSYHTAEIAYVFDRPWALADPARFDDAQARLSAEIQDRWGAFARGEAPWHPAASDAAGAVVALSPGVPGTDAFAPNFAARHRCGVWSSLRSVDPR
ncbi:carboxylesterase/lipase family protein [Lichenibacterium dinghuense]|uniref:carboxylesterase/lipase family protein n=1 Tax=Lichenibacterium dinghuense TaxID=2895977 RepID=UPI001F41B982|nr:carboxylesterase family protein [Lichenibacterium sp. 6Y81]